MTLATDFFMFDMTEQDVIEFIKDFECIKTMYALSLLVL